MAETGEALEAQPPEQEQATEAGELPQGEHPGAGAQGLGQQPEEMAVALERQQG